MQDFYNSYIKPITAITIKSKIGTPMRVEEFIRLVALNGGHIDVAYDIGYKPTSISRIMRTGECFVSARVARRMEDVYGRLKY